MIHFNCLSNVYGLGRALIAFSTLLTLLLNPVHELFAPMSGIDRYPTGNGILSLFNIVPPNYFYLSIVKWTFIVFLLLIIIGWRPRYTGIIHWYISYSFYTAASTLDGGDQVAVALTFLLIPITLVDGRKWHWSNSNFTNNFSRVVAIVPYYMIRLQVSLIYLHSFLAKISREEWINGTAVYYYLHDPLFGLNDFFLSMLDPILKSWLVVIPTWGTLIVQLLLFGALFAPKNHWKYYFIIGIFMHEIFALMLGLFSFSAAMAGALILYLIPINKKLKLTGGKNENYQKN
ncbi:MULTISPECIES: sporulation-delaying protein SdpB family protein [Staphylococcus]|uniref:HTTM-like domain-containing protein n=1 Tax=Staphylococcus equorum TaxID=246432 RepID=A0AAW7AIY5_9STAP|nr:sporulation-delaying protein SdpB family protein [Staphylococcus equorum]MDK9867106.1 hypothetical protein [Staphylococcus equorum]MDK9870104.1 hypothetical protein [Staphylococcus equorum]MDK9873068.1 hypothetical protein [Staphylococcus equorum]MDK9878638.1 hypothetical protein [Staphylococcus equorum]